MARVKVDRLRADTTLQPVAAPAGSSYVVPEQQPVNQRSRARAEKLEQAFAQGQRMVGQYMAQQRAVENEKKSAEALYQVKSNLIRLEKEHGNAASAINDPDAMDKFWTSKFNETFPDLVSEDADVFTRDAVTNVFNTFKLEQGEKAAERYRAGQIEQAGSDFAVSLADDIDKAVAEGRSQEWINTLIEDHIGLMFEGNTLGLDRKDINSIVMAMGEDDNPRWRQVWGWVESRGLENTKTPEYEKALDVMRGRTLKDDQSEFAFYYDKKLLPLVSEGRVKALEAMVEEVKPEFEKQGLDVYQFFDGYIKSARTAKATRLKAQWKTDTLKGAAQRQIILRQEATTDVSNEDLDISVSKSDINNEVVRQLKEPDEGEQVDKFGYPPSYWANMPYFQDPDLTKEATKVFNSMNVWGTEDNTATTPDGTPIQRYQADAIAFFDKMDKLAQYGEGVILYQLGEQNYKLYRQFRDLTDSGMSTFAAGAALSTPNAILPTAPAPDFTGMIDDAADGDGFFLWDDDAENTTYIEGRLKALWNANPHLRNLPEDEGKELVVRMFRESHKVMTVGDRTVAFPIGDVELLAKFGEKMYTPEVQENFEKAMQSAVEDYKKANPEIEGDVWILPHPNRDDAFVWMTPDLNWLGYDSRTLTFANFRKRYYQRVAEQGKR